MHVHTFFWCNAPQIRLNFNFRSFYFWLKKLAKFQEFIFKNLKASQDGYTSGLKNWHQLIPICDIRKYLFSIR